jgi:hypothetical protein
MVLASVWDTPVVEFSVNVDCFDFEIEVIDGSEKLRKETDGGVTVGETAHRQGTPFVLHTGVECRIRMEESGSIYKI